MFVERDVPLRERKQAKTKVNLAKDFLKSLTKQRYEDISIKSICEKAEVSEGTFYNYFPQKADLFNYIISLYYKRNIWETDRKESREDPVKWTEAYFYNIVNMVIDLGDLSNEIFANMIRERSKPKKINISVLEFLYMFPDVKGEWTFDEIPQEGSREDCLDEITEKIVSKKICKKDIKSQDMAAYLKSMLGGISFLRILYEDENINDIVKKQLSIFWDGIKNENH
ncbi:MAG: TetR/AcrR family transcriptional regulator [Candidatus Omnitrophota bacterium]